MRGYQEIYITGRAKAISCSYDHKLTEEKINERHCTSHFHRRGNKQDAMQQQAINKIKKICQSEVASLEHSSIYPLA